MNHIVKMCAALFCSFSTSQAAQASTYQMLLETDANEGAGAEVFGVTFDSYADLLASNVSVSGFSQLNIGANFSIAGLTYDGYPVSTVPPVVPLPAGGSLLLSGLVGLRRRKKPTA